jgi:lysophospholipase L1-like esterase
MRIGSKGLAVITAAGFMLVSWTICFEYFRQGRPVGHGPAGPRIRREAFSRVWTGRQVVLVGLGDSITAGFGARKGHSYFDRLVANPADEFDEMRGICLSQVLTGLRFTNLAVSGSTSLDHLERQFSHLPTFDSNVVGLVVLTTGGNDLIHNYGRTPPSDQAMYGAAFEQAIPWIAGFGNRLEQMIGQLEALFPGGCHVFLANIYDPTDGKGDIESAGLPAWSDGMKVLAAFNGLIGRCAKEHPRVHLVDLHSVFLGHGLHCTKFWSRHYDASDPHYWYGENLEDPNERGHDVIRRLFLKEIAKVAGQLAEPVAGRVE